MTRLERLQKRRAELGQQSEQLRANYLASLGALQVLDEEIAEEQKPVPVKEKRKG